MREGIVYLLKFPNGSSYVGSTVRGLSARMSWHRSRVRAGASAPLYDTWRTQGEPHAEVLEKGVEEEQLSDVEAYWTDKLTPNLTQMRGGRGGPKFLTQERREQIKQQILARPPKSEETRKRTSETLTGRTLPESTKAKMRIAAQRREARKREGVSS